MTRPEPAGAAEAGAPHWFRKFALPGAAVAFGLMLVACAFQNNTTVLRQVSTGLVLVVGWLGLAKGWVQVRFQRPLIVAMLALMGAILISSFLSIDRAYSLKTFTRQHLWFLLLIPAIGAIFSNPRNQQYALWGFLAAGLLSSLPGILFYHRGPQLEEAGLIRRAADYIYTSYDEQGNAYQRARGMLRSYTRSGLIAATSLPFIGVLAFLALKRRRWMWAAFHVLVGIICLYMLLLTKSRGAWLVGGAAVILAYLFLRGRWWHVALALAIGFLGLLALPTERARAMTLLQHARTPDLLLSGRLTLWQHGVDPIKSSPWVGIGYGQNIFQTQAAKDRGFILESDKIQPDLHQLYLQTLAEVGVLGLLVYTGFIAVLLLAGLTAIRRRADAEDAPATAAAFAAVICLLIVGIVYTYNEERVGHFIWAAAGLLVAKISESAPPPIQRHPDQVPHSPA